MTKIVFILSSLNDPHFRKRIEVFREHGYEVVVYGFLRDGQGIPKVDYDYHVLGIIKERHYLSRFLLYLRSMMKLKRKCEGSICFFSSLDIALFARIFIKSRYLYECCDLTELVINQKFIRHFLVRKNEQTINDSLLTIFTSQGFAEYFSQIDSNKYEIIPNKVSSLCPQPLPRSHSHKLRIGFVGVIRFETTFHFVRACLGRQDVELHLYGIYSEGDPWSMKIRGLVDSVDNITYHGRFSNPMDLPSIYSGIDLLLCAYTPSPGVNYAEPNKLYEALYFSCPIIVSDGTYLGKKVREMGIGYVIDSMNESQITAFLDSLNEESYLEKLEKCRSYPQRECIDEYDFFFDHLEKRLTALN